MATLSEGCHQKDPVLEAEIFMVTGKQEPTTSAAPYSLPAPKEGIPILGMEAKIVSPSEATQPEIEREEAGPSFTWSAGTGKGNVLRRTVLPETMARRPPQKWWRWPNAEWVSEMGQSGKEITTLRYYIHHAFQFMEYMVTSHPQQCHFTREQIQEILLLLKKARKDTSRAIMVHQNRVKRAKMAKIPDSASILKCLHLAPERVENLLDEL
ncbi:hypothetical protein CRENBAI_007444 [Crenichthys baileyi]|uniref:Uncharacterized protein n=1 Tax=Crenichthys baileyi TaxID=28760 RepID=A0AAV9SLP5_9TELE